MNKTSLIISNGAAANVSFSATAARFPIMIYGTAAGNTPFAFMVPFNNPPTTLTTLTKSYLLKGVDAVDLLYVAIVAENGKYRIRFTNSTGFDVALYVTLGDIVATV